ncbi:MAG: hypothetical protein M0Z49_04965 [Chloroflexi bacterium]|nr:hypothetical protein [Chloroflexota bacterium]
MGELVTGSLRPVTLAVSSSAGLRPDRDDAAVVAPVGVASSSTSPSSRSPSTVIRAFFGADGREVDHSHAAGRAGSGADKGRWDRRSGERLDDRHLAGVEAHAVDADPIADGKLATTAPRRQIDGDQRGPLYGRVAVTGALVRCRSSGRVGALSLAHV